jgi:hypothetical protein
MDVQQKAIKANEFLFGVSERASRWSIPEGHILALDTEFERLWSIGYPSRSVVATIRREVVDLDDPAQLHIEARFFIEEHRVVMQAELGPRWFGKHRRLLTLSSDVHLHETDLPSLLDKVSHRVQYALKAAQFYGVREAA